MGAVGQPPDFDGQAYLKANPDVAAAGIDPWRHYSSHGKEEGRPYPSIKTAQDIYNKTIQSGYFHPIWYAEQYSDVQRSGHSPLKHFCDFGVWEGRDPGPNFSTSWYLEQYPDIRGQNPLEHFIDHGLREGRSPCPPRGALETMEQTFRSLGHLDPQLNTDPRFSWWKGVPISDGRLHGASADLKNTIRHLLRQVESETRRLILAPWCIHSGADAVVANILHASEQTLGKNATVLVVVDHDKTQGTNWLPRGQQVINFASAAAGFTRRDKMLLLEKFIVAVAPDACLNANSHLSWDLFRLRGKALASYSKLYACIFCPDYDHKMRPAGYAHTHFRDCVPTLSGVISDNTTFPEVLSNELSLTQDDAAKFQTLRQPARRPDAPDPRPTPRQIRNVGVHVLWAGRLSRQKNYRLLADIINLAPDQFKFSVYGWGDDAAIDEFKGLVAQSRKVTLHGPYDGFHSLPTESFDVLLYTSLWDGIPNVVLEAGSQGLPIIASNVGALHEVIGEDRGWLINDFKKPHEYITALRAVLANKDAARSKGVSLRDFIAKEHSWPRFTTDLQAKGSFLHDGDQ